MRAAATTLCAPWGQWFNCSTVRTPTRAAMYAISPTTATTATTATTTACCATTDGVRMQLNPTVQTKWAVQLTDDSSRLRRGSRGGAQRIPQSTQR